MLSRKDLIAYQSHREYPSVSLLAPTHRTAPSNKRDPIKVKNLLAKAIKRLHGEFKKREVAAVVDNLKKLVANIDWEHTLDGLALFASKDKAEQILLPFRVKPRILVDETFATRDLVYAYNRATPYRVLVLSHTTRLFDAWTHTLEEHGKPFPMIHKGKGGKSKLPGGVGINRSAARDDGHRQYFKQVDEAVAKIHRANPLPLFVVGVERNLAFYQEVTTLGDQIAGMLAGNHEQTPLLTLGKLVWRQYDASACPQRTQALVRLDQAVGAERAASGIQEIWKAAVQGQIATLLVEKDFKHPADVGADGTTLLPYQAQGPASLDDVVDESIERVMAAGGEVFFYAPDDLDSHDRIAAVLRR